jgi:hypothetical protein
VSARSARIHLTLPEQRPNRLRWQHHVASAMLKDGLYDLSYRSVEASAPPIGYGLASLRNGKILGSDRWGGVFSGSYRFDPNRGVGEVHVRLNAPPDGVLITGLPSGPSGLELDLVAELNRDERGTSAMVNVGGCPVAVEFSYIGPIRGP